MTAPLVSVVVRSRGRLPSMFELAERCLDQDYPRLELVIVEQTPEQRLRYAEALGALAAQPRVRLLLRPPLGAARARNEGVRAAQGEIVLFVDDDDLPADAGWVSAHAANFVDPWCVAVTGREVATAGAPPTPPRRGELRRCLSYGPLGFPRAHTRHGVRLRGVTALQGGNTAIRREAILRAGGWDEDVTSHDENSFDFRFARVRRPGEHFVYDPRPAIVRRRDITGGLGRRQADLATLLGYDVDYVHRVIGRYRPWRLRALYPLYLAWTPLWTARQARDLGHPAGPGLLLALLRRYPGVLRRAWGLA